MSDKTAREYLNEAIKQIEIIHTNVSKKCDTNKELDLNGFIKLKAQFARGAIQEAARVMGIFLDT